MKRRSGGGSLRARLMLGIGAMLLPFLLAAALGLFYLLPALIGPLEEIVGEVVDEMEPVRHLQITLLTVGAIVHGGRADELAESSRAVDRAFARVRAAPFHDPEERALVAAAWREWQEARSPKAAPEATAFGAESAAAILDGIYMPVRREIERSRAAAQRAKTRSVGVTFAAFLLSLGISLYAAARLAKPLVMNVEILRQGALRLAHGDLSHRVPAAGIDELNDLAAAFNAMAARIEADQVALAELATRDGLTALLNRREFLRLLREELERSRRYGHACTLLMLDVDRFKAVNDAWGHPAGDTVLRAIAERVLNEVRPMDRAARYGGEEFALLLPETGAEGAATAAERIRAAVAAASITLSADHAVSVTVSIGIAAYPIDGTDEEALVAAADKALYAAKASGRNRAVAYSGGAAA